MSRSEKYMNASWAHSELRSKTYWNGKDTIEGRLADLGGMVNAIAEALVVVLEDIMDREEGGDDD